MWNRTRTLLRSASLQEIAKSSRTQSLPTCDVGTPYMYAPTSQAPQYAQGPYVVVCSCERNEGDMSAQVYAYIALARIADTTPFFPNAASVGGLRSASSCHGDEWRKAAPQWSRFLTMRRELARTLTCVLMSQRRSFRRQMTLVSKLQTWWSTH